jgi:hypothetical protein
MTKKNFQDEFSNYSTSLEYAIVLEQRMELRVGAG